MRSEVPPGKAGRLEESIFRALMILSLALVAGSLGLILAVIVIRGLPALNLSMLVSVPQGGYYLGKEGGILNAILGSIVLGLGATLLAIAASLPVAIFLHGYGRKSALAPVVRLSLDILWGVPSIVYGAFGFTLMLFLGMRASLLAGILTVAFFEFPIICRAMDEVVSMVPRDLGEASLAMGATKLDTTVTVVLRQAAPGLVTGILLGFGRGIGDAASVLFTAGYTDYLPYSLLRPVATLPLAVFFQLGTPFPEVQQRAYASAMVLTTIVLVVSLGARMLAKRLSRYTLN